MKNRHFLLYYILIGISMLLLAFISHELPYNKLLILIFFSFFIIGTIDHFKELIHIEKHKLSIINIKIIIGIFSAASITWYINHEMGLGPIVANGVIGLIVALSFPPKLAGAFYGASFVGMSAQNIIPTISIAGIGGLLAGIIILYTKEIYSGIGGKGGTTAAISTQVVSMILKLFV